jgi:plastocyanin
MFNRGTERRAGGWRSFCTGALAFAMLMGPTITTGRAADAKVTIDNFAFSPQLLTIKAGTTVVFENHDDIPHTVVDVGGKFRSKAMDTDQSFSVTFDSIGDVSYFCSLHPHMKGKIVVSP